jgi:hypothetical protein
VSDEKEPYSEFFATLLLAACLCGAVAVLLFEIAT